MIESASDRRCGHHADREADGGVCERCGTFLCAECRIEGAKPETCVPCLQHLDRGPHLRYARVFAVVLMAHGVLMAATGAYYVLFGGMLFGELSDTSAPEESTLPYLGEGMSAFIAIVGLSHLGPGLLQAAAGWRLIRMRAGRLVWFGLLAGLTSLLGCYCFPTAVVLIAVGAWLLTREDVQARLRIHIPPAPPTPD